MSASFAEALVAAPPACVDAWIGERRQRIERALDAALPASDAHPRALHEAMRYAALGGGKRIRALLAHAAGEALGAAPAAVDCVASAVELIHAYSLVHDDLPCMDDDVLRRGRPTVHVVYGEALAMLVGDALQSSAFEVLASAAATGVDPRAVVAMVSELARAAGSTGMAGGQAIDLASIGVVLDAAALEDMHRRKTGALLAASVRLGGACAMRCADPGPATAGSGGDRRAASCTDPAAALSRYAGAIGLAFQIVDDILDVEGDAATLGKTAGKDAQADKPTYVSMIGLEAARALAGQLRVQAREAVAPLGDPARWLAALADRIVLRDA